MITTVKQIINKAYNNNISRFFHSKCNNILYTAINNNYTTTTTHHSSYNEYYMINNILQSNNNNKQVTSTQQQYNSTLLNIDNQFYTQPNQSHICTPACNHTLHEVLDFNSNVNTTSQQFPITLPHTSTTMIPLYMAVPKRKTTPRVQRIRRHGQRMKNHRRQYQYYTLCTSCGSPLRQHHACTQCMNVYPKKTSIIQQNNKTV